MFQPAMPPSAWMILGPVLALAALALLMPLLIHPGERPSDDAWTAGVFYSNPDDPALFVPKRFGVGYTLNFGNRWAWLALAVILLLIALPVALSIVSVRHVLRFTH